VIGVGQQSKNIRTYPNDDSRPKGRYYTQEALMNLRSVRFVPVQ
jgi:hypothetical protein